MRASRLVSILLLLQGRGRLTAQQLASELEVSLRTVYRDLDALAESGVPIYAERGPSGGYRLIEGYQTRLTGLTQAEAEALFLAGVPGPAAELGLGGSLAAASLKLRAALPAELRRGVGRIAERFHLDTEGWYQEPDQPVFLQELAEAVWEQRAVLVRYRRWQGEVERTLEPLGLVLKAGVWYVVARSDERIRTYRVGRVLVLEMCEASFDRPADFDLAKFWEASSQELEASLQQGVAELRLSPLGVTILQGSASAAIKRAARKSQSAPDEEGWVRVTVPIERLEHSAGELLRLGAEAEVLSPPELRAYVVSTIQQLGRRYGLGESAPPSPPSPLSPPSPAEP